MRIIFSEVAERIKRAGIDPFDLVVGIGSGGIVPASLVADELGCELRIITVEYRGKGNKPIHPRPVVSGKIDIPKGVKSVLVVDDISVTGKTLSKVKKLLKKYEVKTLVLKGKADFVIFPEINSCVEWPWTAD